MITDNEIQQVRNDLLSSGVDYIPLQNELIDHILTDIEKSMLSGKDFISGYAEVRTRLEYTGVDFHEVQNDTKTLLDYKSRFLKYLILAVLSITMTAFGFKYFRINGGSMIQILSFVLLSILFFRFALLFYRDKRHSTGKKTAAVLFGLTGLILPFTCILYLFFPQYQYLALRLNIGSYLLLSLSVLVFLNAYKDLNIFGIEQKTRKADQFLIYINILLGLVSLLLYIGGFQAILTYLLYAILGVNILAGILFIFAFRFSNRLTNMLIVSVIVMHIYHIIQAHV